MSFDVIKALSIRPPLYAATKLVKLTSPMSTSLSVSALRSNTSRVDPACAAPEEEDIFCTP